MKGSEIAASALVRWAVPAVWAAIFLVPAACGDAGPAGAGLLESRMDEWTVERDLRIGSVDDPDELLTRVDGVRIAPGGELVVAQRDDDQILVYDTDGQRMATMGGPGEGPSEFGSLYSVGLLGDTVFGGDSGLSRVNFFTVDGQFLFARRWRLEAPPPPTEGTFLSPSPPRVILDDGSALVLPNYGYLLPEEAEGRLDLQFPLLRMDSGGEVLDTVAFHHLELAWTEPAISGDPFPMWAPFEDSPLVELSPDGSGAVFVDRRAAPDAGVAEFRVGRVDPSGDTLRVESFSYRPVPFPDEVVRKEAEQIYERAAGRSGRVPTTSAIEGALRRAGFVPAHLPPVSELVVAGDGSIWLRREDIGRDSVAWDILDRELQPMGRVLLPPRFTVTDGSGDVFVGVELDAFDVPYVVRFRIRSGN